MCFSTHFTAPSLCCRLRCRLRLLTSPKGRLQMKHLYFLMPWWTISTWCFSFWGFESVLEQMWHVLLSTLKPVECIDIVTSYIIRHKLLIYYFLLQEIVERKDKMEIRNLWKVLFSALYYKKVNLISKLTF